MAYHYLLSLFSTPQEAEAIEGDLREERALIAARDGDRVAARWYRRQRVRSVVQLAMAPFREAPFTMIGLGIAFIVATWPLSWVARRAAAALVINLPVYDYIPAATFWQLILMKPIIVLGFVIAVVMGRRAMSTMLAMVFVMTFIVFVIDPAVMLVLGPARPQQLSLWFWLTRGVFALVAWGGTGLLTTAIGITLRRKYRAA